VAVAPDSEGAAAARPTHEAIAAGSYPLWHHLHVACRPGGGIEGDKFVTHLTSARGQRQVERSGYLPSRQVPREVILSTTPPEGGPTEPR
jgi:ABC-type phosphate transport system substrate-binding protein